MAWTHVAMLNGAQRRRLGGPPSAGAWAPGLAERQRARRAQRADRDPPAAPVPRFSHKAAKPVANTKASALRPSRQLRPTCGRATPLRPRASDTVAGGPDRDEGRPRVVSPTAQGAGSWPEVVSEDRQAMSASFAPVPLARRRARADGTRSSKSERVSIATRSESSEPSPRARCGAPAELLRQAGEDDEPQSAIGGVAPP